MSKALPGEHLCKDHQGNDSHYAPHNCTICTLRATISRLREYAGHDAKCRGQPGYDIPCSCGYDNLMKDMEEPK